MEIYLIRHTETVVNKEVCYGQSNVFLKRPFLYEFQRIAEQIDVVNPAIFSSPLIRCAALAKYINNKIGEKIIFDDRLKELNFGQWELKMWNKIDQNQLHRWMNDFVNKVVPGGESYIQLNNRVNKFIDSTFLKGNIKRSAILITHAGVIRCFLCRGRNIPLIDSFNIEVNYGSVFKINIESI